MMRRLAIGLALVGAWAALLAPPPAAAQSVLDRVIAAYGGPEAVLSVDSFREEGMLVARNGGGHGQVVRISGGAETLSIMVSYPDRTELRLLENGRGWRGPGPQDMAEVQGPLLMAMVAQAHRARVPRILLDARSQVTVETTDDGAPVLVLPVGDAMALRMYVDPETHYIVRSESVFLNAPGPLGFATDYSDFRRVGGVVFPFREETFASGVHTASTVLGSVELNPTGARALLPRSR
jgi:hypothetical protein